MECAWSRKNFGQENNAMISIAALGSQTCGEIAMSMLQKGERFLIAVRDDGSVLGTLTQGDIIRALIKNPNDFAINAINTNFLYVLVENESTARELMARHNLSFVPVLDANYHLHKVVSVWEQI